MSLLPIAVFVTGAIFVVYILFGYPLLLALAARRSPQPVRKRDDWKTVTVLLPVHNGERWMRAKLESILALDYPRDLMQIVVISDGSTDATGEIVREFADVELLCVPKGGKALALNAGIERATGEILFFTDVRQPLNRECLRELVACLADPRVGVACGELIILDGATREEAAVGLYWRYEKWIRRQLSRLDSLLVVTGCIYAMRRELAIRLPADTLGDDIYMPQNAFLRGYRLVFEEAAKAYDYPTALDAEFGRKVRTLAGLYQYLKTHYREMLGPANRMWIHFVSYKLGRLLLPFALIAVAVSTFWLPPWLAWPALAAQALVYGAALADPLVPDRWKIKRITSPARTFVVLMAAALCAVAIFFVPPHRLWKQSRVGTPRTAS